MSTSTASFDKTKDPFSATFGALTTGQPSWNGGFRRITINGVPALIYLTRSQMTWGDYYHFMRGTGDFSATAVADVLNNGVVIAGIRRRFFSACSQLPQQKDRIQSVIDRNIRALLEAGNDVAAISYVTRAAVGAGNFHRARAMDQAFKNIFQTEGALRDITGLVDAANKADHAAASQELVAEVFLYALPDDKAPPEVDDQLSRGIGVLLEKGYSTQEVFELFKKAYPDGTDEGVQLKRFIPLFLRSLGHVNYPIPPLKEFLTILKGKTRDDGQKFIDAIDGLIRVIEQNKKKDNDVCFLVLPQLLRVFEDWPKGNPAVRTGLVEELGQRYGRLQREVGPDESKKQSLPGLITFSSLIEAREPEGIDRLYAACPRSFRFYNDPEVENGKINFPLFFYHVLEAAKQSGKPAVVLQNSLALLKNHLRETGKQPYECDLKPYSPFLDKLELLLPIMLADRDITKAQIIPLLEAIVTKERKPPAIGVREAEERLADVIFSFVSASSDKVASLQMCLPILKKQLPGPQYDAFFADVGRILDYLQKTPDLKLAVDRVMAILNNVMPKKGREPLEIHEGRSLLADFMFVLKEKELPGVKVENFGELCSYLKLHARAALLKVRGQAIDEVRRYKRERCGPSEKFLCKAAFLRQLGELLSFGDDTINLGLLPRIQEAFFGPNQEGDADHALMGDGPTIQQTMRASLSTIQEEDLENLSPEVLEELKSWGR